MEGLTDSGIEKFVDASEIFHNFDDKFPGNECKQTTREDFFDNEAGVTTQCEPSFEIPACVNETEEEVITTKKYIQNAGNKMISDLVGGLGNKVIPKALSALEPSSSALEILLDDSEEAVHEEKEKEKGKAVEVLVETPNDETEDRSDLEDSGALAAGASADIIDSSEDNGLSGGTRFNQLPSWGASWI
mmetsp:Transcript_24265/g.33405  ORF Transcript_24265/g.33405 Transcript_24265/m.33405 type:complete len:189 (+) Transcript_24265:453-1019(+)